MINLHSIKVGETVALKDGRNAVVSENFGDGQWVEVTFADDPDGEPEMVHSQDITELLGEQSGG